MNDDLQKRRTRNQVDDLTRQGIKAGTEACTGPLAERMREFWEEARAAQWPPITVAMMFVGAGLEILDEELHAPDDQIAYFLDGLLKMRTRIRAGENAEGVALEFAREMADKYGY